MNSLTNHYSKIQINLAPSAHGHFVSDLQISELPILVSIEQVKNLLRLIKADLPPSWENRKISVSLYYDQNEMIIKSGTDIKTVNKHYVAMQRLFDTCLYQDPLDTNFRLAKLQTKAEEIWPEILSFCGRINIEQTLGRTAVYPPGIRVNNAKLAAAIHEDYTVEINSVWLLEPQDLPFNWDKLTIREKAAFLYMHTECVFDRAQVLLFSYLITHANWDDIRYSAIAHELGHFSQSKDSVISDGKFDCEKSQANELDADKIVGMLKDKNIGYGALLFMRANLAFIGELDTEISHPKWEARIAAIEHQMYQPPEQPAFASCSHHTRHS